MAKLITIIFLGLLCAALVSGRDTRGHGGRSRGGNSQGGNSQGGNSQGGNSQGGNSQGGNSQGGNSQGGNSQGGSSDEKKDVKPITKDEFHTKLTEFAGVFDDASKGVGEIEAAAIKAKGSESVADWISVVYKFGEVIKEDLSKVGPAVDHLGEMLERIAASPDDFTPIPYCDSSVKLANGKTAIITNFDDAREIALVEDLGCFKDKLLKVTAVDADTVKKDEYTEQEAFQQYWEIVSEVIKLGTAFSRFIESLEELENQANGGGSSNGGEQSADIAELVRLLKQLDLGNHRR